MRFLRSDSVSPRYLANIKDNRETEDDVREFPSLICTLILNAFPVLATEVLYHERRSVVLQVLTVIPLRLARAWPFFYHLLIFSLSSRFRCSSTIVSLLLSLPRLRL